MDLLDDTLAIINKSFQNRNTPPKKKEKVRASNSMITAERATETTR